MSLQAFLRRITYSVLGVVSYPALIDDAEIVENCLILGAPTHDDDLLDMEDWEEEEELQDKFDELANDVAPAEEATIPVVTPPLLNLDYRYVRLLGEGANGRTWLAKDRRNGLDLAIKELKFVDNFKSFELFQREAEVMQSISVDGVPKFYKSIFAKDFTSYIIQEYIPYPSLETLLENGKIFDEDEAFTILELVSKILFALQTQYVPAIIHRDIKPGNILYRPRGLSSDPKVWLIDFGAVDNAHKQSSGSTIAGTFGYMAPEQLQGEVSPRSDFYALGATILHLITGVFPYEIPSELFQLKFHPVIQEKAPKTTKAMVDLLDTMLASDVEKRPQNIEELRRLIFEAHEASIKYREVPIWDDEPMLYPSNKLESWYFNTRLGRWDVYTTERFIGWRRKRARNRALKRIDKQIAAEKAIKEAIEKRKQEELERIGIVCKCTVRRVSVVTVHNKDINTLEGIFCHNGDWFPAYVLANANGILIQCALANPDECKDCTDTFQVQFIPERRDISIKVPQTIWLSETLYTRLTGKVYQNVADVIVPNPQ